MIYSLGERRIETHGKFFVADSASVIGSVSLGENASVWFNSVLRGDAEWIRIGDATNVQDGSVIHADPQMPTVLGMRVSIGHKVMLHGCAVASDSLIGNGAIVLDGASIGAWSIVAAGSLVPPRMVVPDGTVVLGNPAKVIRETSARDRALISHAAAHYMELGETYRQMLHIDERFAHRTSLEA